MYQVLPPPDDSHTWFLDDHRQSGEETLVYLIIYLIGPFKTTLTVFFLSDTYSQLKKNLHLIRFDCPQFLIQTRSADQKTMAEVKMDIGGRGSRGHETVEIINEI